MLITISQVVAGRVDSVDVLAATLWDEARGQSFDCKWGVASVIYNRAKGDKKRLIEVVVKPKQFSGWNRGQLAVTAITADEKMAWADCRVLAKRLLSGNFQPLNDATHFYSGDKPYWADSMMVVEVIDGVTFCKEVGKSGGGQ